MDQGRLRHSHHYYRVIIGRWAAVVILFSVALTACGGPKHTGAASASGNVAAPLLSAPPTRSGSADPGSNSSPASASPVGASPVGASPTARTVTVLGSGDVLIHPALWEQAAADAKAENRPGYDFGPIYASIAPVTRAADLAICEMETPL
ncbi:MAG: hypothetical protein QOE89_362, partial [Pseudonocardiales bacterium]|nr:hypothetical protein [Pseudonocardiales bacterium]